MSAIYIHIPFCRQACNYCNFHFSTQLKNKTVLLNCIHNELRLRKEELHDTPVSSVYLGGGTPSLLTPTEISNLLETIDTHFNLKTDAEISIEINPDDLTEPWLEEISSSPINRLSIGVQSFFEDDLVFMNRAHTAREASENLKRAFDFYQNISVDLIYGIPGMSLQKWQDNLEKLWSFPIKHLSAYALTAEPNTAYFNHLKNGLIEEPDEEVVAAHYFALLDAAAERNFTHYEFSSFGAPGYFGRHNIGYWQGIPYLGVGPGAHSYNGQERSWNVSNNNTYIKAIKRKKRPHTLEKLSLSDRFNEYVMTGLRTIWGVSLPTVELQFGSGYVHHLLQQAKPHLEAERLSLQQQVLNVTRSGIFMTDGIASDLFATHKIETVA